MANTNDKRFMGLNARTFDAEEFHINAYNRGMEDARNGCVNLAVMSAFRYYRAGVHDFFSLNPTGDIQ